MFAGIFNQLYSIVYWYSSALINFTTFLKKLFDVGNWPRRKYHGDCQDEDDHLEIKPLVTSILRINLVIQDSFIYIFHLMFIRFKQINIHLDL